MTELENLLDRYYMTRVALVAEYGLSNTTQERKDELVVEGLELKRQIAQEIRELLND